MDILAIPHLRIALGVLAFLLLVLVLFALVGRLNHLDKDKA